LHAGEGNMKIDSPKSIIFPEGNARGEYLNEQAYLTSAKKRQFQLENPKAQVSDTLETKSLCLSTSLTTDSFICTDT
jgi:hypothetical protein